MKPFFPVFILILLCVGCGNFQGQQKPQVAPSGTAGPVGANQRFVIYSSVGETFLVNSETGKVWRYDAKEKSFLETPVTSKIVRFDANGNRVPPDPKDPLGLYEKP